MVKVANWMRGTMSCRLLRKEWFFILLETAFVSFSDREVRVHRISPTEIIKNPIFVKALTKIDCQ